MVDKVQWACKQAEVMVIGNLEGQTLERVQGSRTTWTTCARFTTERQNVKKRIKILWLREGGKSRKQIVIKQIVIG